MFNIDKIINAQFGETKSTIRTSVKKIVKSGEFGTETIIGDIALELTDSVSGAHRVMIETLLTAQIEYSVWLALATRGSVRQDEFATRTALIEANVNQMASKFTSITGENAEDVFASYMSMTQDKVKQHVEIVSGADESTGNGSQTAQTGAGQTAQATTNQTAGNGVQGIAGATGFAQTDEAGRAPGQAVTDKPPFNTGGASTTNTATQPVGGAPVQNAPVQGSPVQNAPVQNATSMHNPAQGTVQNPPLGNATPSAQQNVNYGQPANGYVQNAQATGYNGVPNGAGNYQGNGMAQNGYGNAPTANQNGYGNGQMTPPAGNYGNYQQGQPNGQPVGNQQGQYYNQGYPNQGR